MNDCCRFSSDDQGTNIFLIIEMIVLSNGHNVPLHIEERIKKEVPFLSNVVLVGDGRDYVCCLVTLKVRLKLENRFYFMFIFIQLNRQYMTWKLESHSTDLPLVLSPTLLSSALNVAWHQMWSAKETRLSTVPFRMGLTLQIGMLMMERSAQAQCMYTCTS